MQHPSVGTEKPSAGETGESGREAERAGGVNPPRSAAPPTSSATLRPLVFECGRDGVAEHLLVRRHLASAWAEAPELAWASTGADWPRLPSAPPAVFTSDASKLFVEPCSGVG